MIDVIITSTCRNTIKKTLLSFKTNVICYKKFNFIINVDVHITNLIYLPFLKTILDKLDINDYRTNINSGKNPIGHSKAVNYLFNKIKEKYYFHLEYDWIFLKKINLDPLIELMEKNLTIHHLRFSKQSIKDYTWLYLWGAYPSPLLNYSSV